jgi:hypothetical protein
MRILVTEVGKFQAKYLSHKAGLAINRKIKANLKDI